MTIKQFLITSPLSARIGFGIVLLNLFAASFAPVIAPYTENEIVGDIWLASSYKHFLGTDQLGRDLFSRILYGARNTISIAFLITFLSFTMGTIGGFIAATLKGWTDQLLVCIVDMIMAFPTLIFALLILSVTGTSIPALVVIIAILDSTKFFRLSRALGMDIVVMDFVEVARLRGEGVWWIISHEILPNAAPALIAECAIRFCFVFLFISALSFLGLGIQPPAADWGSMVKENASAITFGIPVPLWPAGSIAFLTIGVNLIADWFLNINSQIRNV